jgi:hypothetical protein
MSLRDQIAISAMQAMLSRASIADLETTDGYTADECSQDAYIYADAMLRERKKKHLRAREFRTLSAAISANRRRPRCEHGVPEGDWCEPCNKEYKRAAREHGLA